MKSDMFGGRSLGVDGKRILALCLSLGIEAEHMPVACVDSLLHLDLAVLHAALLDAVHLAGSVADDERRAVVSLCLGECLEQLILCRRP